MRSKIHFEGLDGLRFISISFVVLHHLFTFKNYYGYVDFDFPKIGLIGYYGIQFFFAGSGFLITYLLLAEYNRRQKISLRNFYIRRILRIWPAYYLLIFLALVLFLKNQWFEIPVVTNDFLNSDYKTANKLFFSFLPHIASNYATTAPYIHPTYTIGIEEQFYLVWGLVFFVFGLNSKKVFIFFLIAVPLLQLLYYLFYNPAIHTISTLEGVFFKSIYYLKYSRVTTFSLGALFAYVYFFHTSLFYFLKSKIMQLVIYTLFLVSIYFDVSIPLFRDEYISLVMLLIFIVSTFKTESIIKYSAGWLTYLGKISYGIYLFHIIAIVMSLNFFKNVCNISKLGIFELSLLVIMTMALSVLFGWASYNFYESFFLKLKKRFSRV